MEVRHMDLLSAARERTLILDGATGTELMRHGFRSGCPEEWNLTHADVVSEMHRAYFAAGADIVHTVSFGGSRLKLAAYGRDGDVVTLNEAAARLAVAVRDGGFPGRLVAGDMGSTGKFVKPMGELEPAELRDVFAEQAAALAAGGVDVISVETMYDLAEARMAVEGARSAAPSLPILASLTYKRGPRGYRTMMGVDPRTAVAALLDSGADVVGCNCSIAAEEMVALVGELRAATDAPVHAQPNAGQPRLEKGETVYDETPEHFAAVVPELVAQGANLVGGCCGTTPEHIAALVAALRG
jgi:5-methyltetrahydrofolate--homocysteine methyltransferase